VLLGKKRRALNRSLYQSSGLPQGTLIPISKNSNSKLVLFINYKLKVLYECL
jgi:hypothetical protein